MDRNDIPLEAVITKAIRKYLADNDFLVFKLAGSALQGSGLPDLLAMKNGKVIFFEVKRPFFGKISKIQETTIRKIREKAVEAHVVYSVDDVVSILRDMEIT